MTDACPKCNGAGEWAGEVCGFCHGAGRVCLDCYEPPGMCECGTDGSTGCWEFDVDYQRWAWEITLAYALAQIGGRSVTELRP